MGAVCLSVCGASGPFRPHTLVGPGLFFLMFLFVGGLGTQTHTRTPNTGKNSLPHTLFFFSRVPGHRLTRCGSVFSLGWEVPLHSYHRPMCPPKSEEGRDSSRQSGLVGGRRAKTPRRQDACRARPLLLRNPGLPRENTKSREEEKGLPVCVCVCRGSRRVGPTPPVTHRAGPE